MMVNFEWLMQYQLSLWWNVSWESSAAIYCGSYWGADFS